MSLKPRPIPPVPDETARIARAAFPKGSPYLTLRDQVGIIFHDDDFLDLYSETGQPALAPWRLAWITIMQFRENLADRQAAEAVRARLDWKYLLALELSDPGFDFSVLSEFRDRLLAGQAEERLLDKMLAQCQAQGLLKSRGQQRTDSTQVLAAIRVLNRLELVAETLRAALNELATAAPEWLQQLAPIEWFDCYARRIEDVRLPKDKAERAAYAQSVGEDGFVLLEALATAEAPAHLRQLPMVEALRRTWQRHYERLEGPPDAEGQPPKRQVRLKDNRDLARAAEGIESPYDVEARYRHKRDTSWSGYMVHLSETCEDETPHLVTHVHTTAATVHEAMCTDDIHQALVDKALPPDEHLVDAAYVSAALLVKSHEDHDITLRGPTRPDPSWQSQVEGAYSLDQFAIDWERQQVRCPQGKMSVSWAERVDSTDHPYIQVRFSTRDCGTCAQRACCTRAQPPQARAMKLHPQVQHEAFKAAQAWYASETGQRQYAHRAGIEGTLSQGVRAFGMRQTRYHGLAKTHLQSVAIAAALNVDRIVAWLEGRPRAKTRTSRFASLAPLHTMEPG
jgi:transposase